MLTGKTRALTGFPLQADGRVLDIADFPTQYLEWYDGRRNLTRLRSLAPGNPPGGYPTSVEDAIDMIEVLLEAYQCEFRVSPMDPWTVFLPNLVIDPKPGDEIHNRTTDEVYTIDTLGTDPQFGTFDHWVRLRGETPPGRSDRLELVDRTKYVRFVLAYPMTEARKTQESDGELGERDAADWVPTVTVRVTRREPASLGKEPFGRSKELKSRIVDVFRDPKDRVRYSIEIWQQRVDNLLQFDCWDRDPKVAMRLASWFRAFMREHTRTLIMNGVEQILWWDQRDDQATERWREDIVAQTCRYVFRTADIQAVRRRNLTWLSFEVSVAQDPSRMEGGTSDTWLERTHTSDGRYLYGRFRLADLDATGEIDAFTRRNPYADDPYNDNLRV